jgi:hypothetical protein
MEMLCVGDIVKAVRDEPKGRCGVVVDEGIISATVYFPSWGGGHCGGLEHYSKNCYFIGKHDLELIARRPTPKVGDRVLGMGANWDGSFNTSGIEGMIVGKLDSDGDIIIDFDGNYGREAIKPSNVLVLPKIIEPNTSPPEFVLWDQLRYESTPYFSDGFCAPQLLIRPTPTKAKKGLMAQLQAIPNRIKRLLDKGQRALYQLGWIDEELELTEEGQEKLLDYLYDQHNTAFGELAIKEVKKLEAEKKDK